MFRTVTAAMLASVAGSAVAQPTDLVVQSNQSGVTAEICINPSGIGQRCDTDDSPVTGMLSIQLDSYSAPGAITLHDFSVALAETMSYNMDWGFFIGGVNLELTGVVVSYATPGTPTGPVAVDGSGDFEFPAVPVLMTGTGSYEGYGPIIGSLLGSGTFNLADFGEVDAAMAGNVAVSGDQVVLSGAQTFYNEGEFEGVQATIDGTATLVAVGDVPECAADFNGDGVVDTRDVLAFLNAWTAQEPSSDCDTNGAIDTRDVLCFLNAWTAGC